ncbi:molecular chaperone GrpE [Actinomyces sp. oral taxon 414]|uniref:nucleotide exchange factor GrpE n=1 Tax=Actinomyces sp. oral taxon 414 TaxID=712122 RepID=UPI0006AD9295|nr:nucleotide exchange factor GrpE [Actinomyces sp. oral taxon 414]ALD00056.1 molecular chaperone GrpE [Actinomyces sp. oral taxon 414]
MTGQSDSGRDQSLDPALADEVESAFEEVRDELGQDPQADLDTGAAGSDGTAASDGAAAPGEPGGLAASGAPGPDGPARAEGAREPAQEPAEDGSASELEQARAEAARLTDELARARADQYNLQQEYQGFVRRSREGAAGHREAGRAAVVEALIPVLDEIELARQHGDLTGTFATTAGKLETILADKFSLVRFGEVGEPFDPTLHEALMATESDEVDEPSIALVLQPGYRLGEKVVRAARVQVANPA